MKILFVAVFGPKSTNTWQAVGFESLGHTVIRYDYRAKAVQLDGAIHNTNPKRDNDLISVCQHERPDIILFSKCNKMHYSVIQDCGKIGTTALWYMDNFRNIDAELKHKMAHSDYVFCATKKGMEVSRAYNKQTYRLHGGYDPKVHCPVSAPIIRDTCFVGSMHSNRNTFHSRIQFPIITGTYGKDLSKIFSETKINLNFTEGDGVSNRIFKILAAKGFLLTMSWGHEMNEDFTPGKDFAIFNTPEELVNKINYYLSNEHERKSIAKHGYNTVKQYDNINFAKVITTVVKCKN